MPIAAKKGLFEEGASAVGGSDAELVADDTWVVLLEEAAVDVVARRNGFCLC